MANIEDDYDAFHAKWKGRLGLKSSHLAIAHMRGKAMDVAGYGELVDDPTAIGIHVRVDGRGVDASVDSPDGFKALAIEWSEALTACYDGDDPRKFTKDFITQTVALNKHLDPGGEMILSAVAWLASQGEELLAGACERGSAVSCEVTFEEQRRRFQLFLLKRTRSEPS